MRQMAINAFDSSVGSLVKPGFELRLHDMAGCAEFGCLGACQELWRAKSNKEADSCADGPNDKKIFQFRPIGPFHMLTPFLSIKLHVSEFRKQSGGITPLVAHWPRNAHGGRVSLASSPAKGLIPVLLSGLRPEC